MNPSTPIYPLQGRILVPGESCVGVAFSCDSSPVNRGIFVTGSLKLSDYTNVVNSVAVICEDAEPTSHIAVVCRIVGVPVLTLEGATKLLPLNERLMVDFRNGQISKTEFLSPHFLAQPLGTAFQTKDQFVGANFRFQISILDMPRLITHVNLIGRNDVDYFFLREEFIWVKQNLHPFRFFKDSGTERVTELLVKSLVPLVSTLNPGQFLNFRSLDLRSDQLNQFGDSALHEPNPHLGMHGIRDLLRHEEFLVAELRAVDQLYEMGFRNVIYSLPFLTLESELEAVLLLRKKACKHAVSIGIFVETPAAVYELPHLIKHDISAVFVGTKDLAQLILAADRDNTEVSGILRITSRPVVQAISTIVDCCSSAQLPVFVFTYLDELSRLISVVPGLNAISVPASDYIRAFGTR